MHPNNNKKMWCLKCEKTQMWVPIVRINYKSRTKIPKCQNNYQAYMKIWQWEAKENDLVILRGYLLNV